MNKVVLLFVGILGLMACRKEAKPIAEYFETGELKSLTYIPSNREEGYKYVEEFNKQGLLIRRTEYLNDTLNGYDYVYYEESNIITGYNYLMGKKHGVGRSVYGDQKISHETLFINDTALIVLYATQFYSDRDYNDLDGFGYTVYRDKGASAILSEKNEIGRISLAGSDYIDIMSLRQEDISKKGSVWHYHNLPDSGRLKEKINFEVDLSSYIRNARNVENLYSELYLGSLNTDLKLTDTLSVFTSSPSNNAIINGSLKLDKKGSNLVTGIIRMYVLIEGDTAWTFKPFYKQIYVE